MRPIFVALAAALALTATARAANLVHFDDAPLHAVQFVDDSEGWTVGAEGIVLHTIDGGKTWERQPTGARATLQAVHFLDPYTGWIAGREELPHGGGSVGVILFTRDGGLKWQRVTLNALPGLNRIRFLDSRTGIVAGDGSEQYPTGVFRTTDGGRTWEPMPGPRATTWLAADFLDAQTGALAGAWNRLAMLRQGHVAMADVDSLGGRNLRSLSLVGKRGVAVGQGGLVLLNENVSEPVWGVPDLGLPLGVRSSWDFHAVHARGSHIWAVGRPGSAVLHSANEGGTWEVQRTGQPLPLQGIFFLNEQRGWAVGEYGTIVTTADGGKNWQVQRRGGQRAAVLCIHAHASGLPVEVLAGLGGEEGYLATALRVQGADPASAVPQRSSEPQRFVAAVRLAAGAAGETLWQFPLAGYLSQAAKPDLVNSWDQLHGKRAAEQMLRQLVLALRIWRPEVVITDDPDPKAGGPVEALIAEAAKEAFGQAADPKAFPEHIQQLGLEPWQPAKLYACWHSHTGAHVTLDLNEPANRLEATARNYAASAEALLVEDPPVPPSQRYFRLLASKDSAALNHQTLMEGLVLPPGGVARRNLGEVKEPTPEIVKALQARRNLEVLAETPASGLTNPDKLLALIGPSLAPLPPDQAAPAAFAIANHYAHIGQWTLAREAFLLMVDRYPAHPLAADAYRWLIRYNTSSEARRRHELGQFLMMAQTEFKASQPEGAKNRKPGDNPTATEGKFEITQTRHLQVLSSTEETRRWYQGSLDIEPRLAAFGPLFATDPATQFCLQAARRNLGDFETPKKWYAKFVSEHPDSPWRQVAQAELWLTNRSGPPPRPVAVCRATDTRPFLDGNLDDACWQHKPMVLHNAVGDTMKDYPTEVWLAYDKDFLYLALRCKHPSERYVAPVKERPRDADLRPYDRVSLLLDLDRDYSTCFHLQVDQRGCVRDDCWGDLTWNPRWFVAVQSQPDCWQIEAAIPMTELTGETITLGHAWACNVVRVMPGRGVQAWSTPADVQPRPEGMGLLVFTQEQRPAAPGEKGAAPMPKVP
jgi:photosystem II stability/assembly factor-like uncharacterized protein/tetratricopeptide (TPR) repeat protein